MNFFSSVDKGVLEYWSYGVLRKSLDMQINTPTLQYAITPYMMPDSTQQAFWLKTGSFIDPWE
jgi:hypothetical protein